MTERHMDVLKAYIVDVYWSRATTHASACYDSFKEPANYDLHLLSPIKMFLVNIFFKPAMRRKFLEEINIPDPREWGWNLDPDAEHVTKTCFSKTGIRKSFNCAKFKLGGLSMCGCIRSSKICIQYVFMCFLDGTYILPQ